MDTTDSIKAKNSSLAPSKEHQCYTALVHSSFYRKPSAVKFDSCHVPCTSRIRSNCKLN